MVLGKYLWDSTMLVLKCLTLFWSVNSLWCLWQYSTSSLKHSKHYRLTNWASLVLLKNKILGLTGNNTVLGWISLAICCCDLYLRYFNVVIYVKLLSRLSEFLVFIFSGHPKAFLKITSLFNDTENQGWIPDAFQTMIWLYHLS